MYICCCLVAQLCPTLCNPMDYNPTDSSIHVGFQAEILEWVSSSSSRGSSSPRDQTHVCKSPALQADILSLSHWGSPIVCFVFFVQLLSHLWLFVTLRTIWVLQARILEWVAISFSKGSSWTRDQTHVSLPLSHVLYHWAPREAQFMFTHTS